MRNVLAKICRENKKKHILRSITFFPENRALYEIMWKSIAGPERPQMII
jgi:hypothetical protein